MPRIPTGAVHDAEAAADRAVELAAPGAHVIIWAAEPFGIIEAIWAGVAVRRWRTRTLTVTAV